jgi:hypothetical protein
MKPPKRLFKDRPDPDDEPPPPHGGLFAACYDVSDPGKRYAMLDLIRGADIVLGYNIKTGEQVPYYGLAMLKRVIRRGEAEQAKIVGFPIDTDTDDVEVLVAMVEVVKGACCYSAFEAPESRDPGRRTP